LQKELDGCKKSVKNMSADFDQFSPLLDIVDEDDESDDALLKGLEKYLTDRLVLKFEKIFVSQREFTSLQASLAG
jgi:hypothetical protein